MLLLLTVYKNPILQDKHFVFSGPKQVKHWFLFFREKTKNYKKYLWNTLSSQQIDGAISLRCLPLIHVKHWLTNDPTQVRHPYYVTRQLWHFKSIILEYSLIPQFERHYFEVVYK